MLELARRRVHPALAALMRDRFERYNAQAEDLQRAVAEDPDLTQIAPTDDVPNVSQLEFSQHAIRDGLRAGANAIAASFGLPDVDLLWQPEAYKTT
ncbi:MAG TPA: hypothetical protein VGW98_02795 [Solirubrobacteraceae bacterium]|jgi:hypothetical protein|nr:hypothetical protein [Solirubrobacteraceae bacterium]